MGGTNFRKGVGLLPTGHFLSRQSPALTRKGELEGLHWGPPGPGGAPVTDAPGAGLLLAGSTEMPLFKAVWGIINWVETNTSPLGRVLGFADVCLQKPRAGGGGRVSVTQLWGGCE